MTKTPNTATESWLYIFNNSTHLIFSGNPSNINAGNLSATVLVDDGHGLSTNNFILDFCVKINNPPVLVGSPTIVPGQVVGSTWNYAFQHSWVTDADGHPLTFSHSSNTSISWMSCTDTTSAYSWSGTLNDNTLAVQYQFKITISDGRDSLNHTQTFTISPNQSPVAGSVFNVSMLAPSGKNWTFGNTLFTDPESDSLTKSIQLNDSSTIPTWLTYDLSTYSFSIVTSSNAFAGDHKVTLTAKDPYNAALTKIFYIEVQYNTEPVRTGSIPHFYSVPNFLSTFEIGELDTLFYDPENSTLSGSMSQADDSPLPTFMAFNNVTNRLTALATKDDIRTWVLKYTAVDTGGYFSSIFFQLVVSSKLT